MSKFARKHFRVKQKEVALPLKMEELRQKEEFKESIIYIAILFAAFIIGAFIGSCFSKKR